jgi:hypothetical protein
MFREGDRVRLRETVVIGDQAFAAGSVGPFERKREEWAQSSGDENAGIAMWYSTTAARSPTRSRSSSSSGSALSRRWPTEPRKAIAGVDTGSSREGSGVPAQSGDAGLERSMTRRRGPTPGAATPALEAELQRAYLVWETEGGSLGPDAVRPDPRVRVAVSASDGAKQKWTSA